MLEERISELKAIIADNDGRNAADSRFARAVDELISAFYDDIGRVSDVSLRALFDLFVIKVLYVGRRSTHADVIDYLGAMLTSYLHARELFPPDEKGRPRRVYFSDIVKADRDDEPRPNRFETYRGYADSALFLSGVFGGSLRNRRPSTPTVLRRQPARPVDAAYYVSTGKAMYRMASLQDEAQRQRATLERLAASFEVYAEALDEMSARYIMGFDIDLIADKMLDSINARSLEDARRYAEMLRIDL